MSLHNVTWKVLQRPTDGRLSLSVVRLVREHQRLSQGQLIPFPSLFHQSQLLEGRPSQARRFRAESRYPEEYRYQAEQRLGVVWSLAVLVVE